MVLRVFSSDHECLLRWNIRDICYLINNGQQNATICYYLDNIIRLMDQREHQTGNILNQETSKFHTHKEPQAKL
jgi:hypothetical protein